MGVGTLMGWRDSGGNARTTLHGARTPGCLSKRGELPVELCWTCGDSGRVSQRRVCVSLKLLFLPTLHHLNLPRIISAPGEDALLSSD